MGHRANYVLVESGQPHIYFSRWGALSLPAVLVAGPEATIAYVRTLTPDDTLLDNVWAEGGMVLQVDRRELRFFGGVEIERKPYLRRLLLRALRTLWTGWSVEWARDGIADLALSVGWEVSRVLDPEFADAQKLLYSTEPLLSEEEIQVTQVLQSAHSVFSVRWPSGDIKDYLLVPSMTRALSVGPRLLHLVVGQSSTTLPSEDAPDLPREGAALDVHAQVLWMGEFGEFDPRHLPAIARRWPGWQVDGHVDGLVRQLELSGRNPAPWMVPEERALHELLEELMRPGVDPQAWYTALAQSGQFPTEDTLTVGTGFFSADQPPQSPEERRTVLLRVLRTATQADAAAHDGPDA